MRVLVTGGAGFLGRHVAQHFGEAGHEVAIFDQAASDMEFESIVGDLVNANDVKAAVADKDVVVHIGAIGDVYLAGEQPALASSVNVTGSANIAEAALAGGAKVVYASTWEVYGEPEYEPMDENHPTNPDHPYNITKLAGERILMAAGHLRGLPIVALRLGTAFGSGLRPNSVFRIFIDKARAGEPITIQGDGAQGRQFTHASDIARAFLLAAESDITGVALNTIAPDTTSIKSLAEMVVERFPTELTFGAPRPGDVPPALVSARKASEVLGWRAEVPFEAGLDELVRDVVANG
ncbi:MAG: NAD-dependent epimerase/dehydratase family protein [Acidimicrobiia bacterium]|nr:NAD-dependent epimerase/dehydratase family protein [Acidimicrobiia bacterium]